ncbi:MAG: bifunctional UDP-N-acetylglucosamine diphosphorylase/glucosamine-1-phosphate N-acetyltransferase GlmU [Alphaproteobacteria bacterium]|nr:bifunctional UDP-N-acetylglucosamine diphosphorylase/glucosamine-1-phosphate N-acetyltransferase GlmU [Alphaproteobacteria bacterium]
MAPVDNDLAVIVLAAGQGTRMKSAHPKVLHEVGGRPLIGHIAAELAALGAGRIVLVVGPGMDKVAHAARAAAPNVRIDSVVQHDRLGTGHAAIQARSILADFRGDILVALGDAPFVSSATFAKLRAGLREPGRPAICVLGVRLDDPAMFGRMVVGADGVLERIVEAKDATAAEREIDLVNTGVMAFAGEGFFDLLAKIEPTNAQKEFYLTDAVALARKAGRSARAIEGSRTDWLAANDRVELAALENEFQARARRAAMLSGVSLVDPSTVWFSYDTRIGADTVVQPCVQFGPGVSVGRGVQIKGFCHIEGATIADGAVVGPFARLRPGTRIAIDAHIGNFVEIKNADIEAGAKVNHLTYIGDARIGEKANIGAGTITCNYDGFEKFHTDIGAGAFIGSNSALVAPVKIGDGALVGAGSVVTEDVPADALIVARGRPTQSPGWAKQFRQRRAAEKAERKKGN